LVQSELKIHGTLSVVAPGGGQYQVSGGVYTFNAADAGQTALVSYAYDSVQGQKLSVQNDWTRFAPDYALYLTSTFNSKPVSLWLPSVSTTSWLYLLS
jgi:hypothetical protein